MLMISLSWAWLGLASIEEELGFCVGRLVVAKSSFVKIKGLLLPAQLCEQGFLVPSFRNVRGR